MPAQGSASQRHFGAAIRRLPGAGRPKLAAGMQFPRPSERSSLHFDSALKHTGGAGLRPADARTRRVHPVVVWS